MTVGPWTFADLDAALVALCPAVVAQCNPQPILAHATPRITAGSYIVGVCAHMHLAELVCALKYTQLQVGRSDWQFLSNHRQRITENYRKEWFRQGHARRARVSDLPGLGVLGALKSSRGVFEWYPVLESGAKYDTTQKDARLNDHLGIGSAKAASRRSYAPRSEPLTCRGSPPRPATRRRRSARGARA